MANEFLTAGTSIRPQSTGKVDIIREKSLRHKGQTSKFLQMKSKAGVTPELAGVKPETGMLELAKKNTAEKETSSVTCRDILKIEHFIEKNSADYKRKEIWSNFSSLMTYKEFNGIINELLKTGKIAIDRKGIIVWIWYPKSNKEYLNPKNLVF
jgi:hypothetical protein